MRHSDMVWCHKVTETTDDAFQEQYFLLERGASIGVDFLVFNFQDLLHAQEHII